MNHTSLPKDSYEHVITFTVEEIAKLLRAEAVRRYQILDVIDGTERLEIPEECSDDDTCKLTFLSR